MPRNAIAYEEDFFAWTVEQARLLRAGELSDVDVLNVAEELEGMGRNNRRELRSRLIVLLAHLLKWQHQPEGRSRSWSGTIREQRLQIELILEDSPSLRPVVSQTLAHSYGQAQKSAAEETGLSPTVFPISCPFTPDQILADDFMPA